MGCMLVSFILAVELAGKRTRTFVGINAETPFALGEAIVSLVGIQVKDWKDFQVSISDERTVEGLLIRLQSIGRFGLPYPFLHPC